MSKVTAQQAINVHVSTSHSSKRLSRSCLALAVSQALLMPVQAAEIVVNSDSDTDATDSACTLREAVRSANNDISYSSGCVAGSGADTISFSSSINAIALTQTSTLNITSDISINGPGQVELLISGEYNAGVFYIGSGSVTIQDLSIANGLVNYASGGGGIALRAGELTLRNCQISNNSSTGYGGGVSIVSNTTTSPTLNVINCAFLDNAADITGGAIYSRGASLFINNSSISENQATVSAGAIQINPAFAYLGGAKGELTLVNSTISNNSAPFIGAISADNSSVNIFNSTIIANAATVYSGGALSVVDATIMLANTIVSGNDSATGEDINNLSNGIIITNNNNIFGDASKTTSELFTSGFTAGATDLNLSSDTANATDLDDIIQARNSGGSNYFIPSVGSPALGAANPTICSNDIVNGVDQRGFLRNASCDIGAIEFTSATLVVDSKANVTGGADCTLASAILSSNGRLADGGCARGGDATIINFDDNVFPANANNVIMLDEPLESIATSTLTINGQGNPGVTLQMVTGSNAANSDVLDVSASTVALNKLKLTGGIRGLNAYSSEVTINNSTITGNSSGANFGGGIYASQSRLLVNNSTISNNIASGGGGGIEVYDGSYLRLSNSTVSGNSQTDTGSSYAGGAIEFDGGYYGEVNAVIINSTITGNSAATLGGGLFLFDDNTANVSIINSIIAGNQASNGAQEIYGGPNTVTSLGNNLFGSSAFDSGTSFNVMGAFPSLTDLNGSSSDGLNLSLSSIIGPLANNGGVSLTHALLANSPAKDAANNALCLSNAITRDQRGEPRNDRKCDIGAFELEDGSTCYVIKAINGNVMSFCL